MPLLKNLDGKDLDHAFWLFPADAYRKNAGAYPLPLKERQTDWLPTKMEGQSTNHSFSLIGRRETLQSLRIKGMTQKP
jgi:hypothetical protein